MCLAVCALPCACVCPCLHSVWRSTPQPCFPLRRGAHGSAGIPPVALHLRIAASASPRRRIRSGHMAGAPSPLTAVGTCSFDTAQALPLAPTDEPHTSEAHTWHLFSAMLITSRATQEQSALMARRCMLGAKRGAEDAARRHFSHGWLGCITAAQAGLANRASQAERKRVPSGISRALTRKHTRTRTVTHTQRTRNVHAQRTRNHST